MEIPNKLYFKSTDYILEIFSIKKPEDEIEYIRTDAFIKKAEEFIYSALNDGIMGTANIEDFMKLFKEHMQEE